MKFQTQYLQHALQLADQRRGFCAPNPAVAAVVVKNQRIVASGCHWAAGQPHAEAVALAQLTTEQSSGATVYVTLEPCCHYGRTPPCTQLLIERGIKSVYYGFADPNPLVAGKGAAQLNAHGVRCTHHPLAEIDQFYQSYVYWTHTHLPWVTAKLALTLDGKIAGPQGQRLKITGAAVQTLTHQWRKRSDAILTTAITIIKDDPLLNVRLPNETHNKPIYMLDTHLMLPITAQLIHSAAHITLFYQQPILAKQSQIDIIEQRRKILEALGIRCVAVAQKHGKLCLNAVLTQIGHDGVHDLWLEAGGTCFEAFAREKLLQRAFLCVAPVWLGEQAQSAFSDKGAEIFSEVKKLSWQQLGSDTVGELRWQ